jgi:ankyrin repeat protein
MSRAENYDELLPLIDLIRAGKLFDVQAWITSGKPVSLPLKTEGKRRKISPLEIAINTGFHSIVQVLLEGGAAIEELRYSALVHALQKRRLDFVKLIAAHGADIRAVGMRTVFDTWDKDIVSFFIERGADVETGQPLAYALCRRERPMLGILKRYQDRFPSFREQANIALRHHCREGNVKWVALMLWAGADPYARGPDEPEDEYYSDGESYNALELAALWDHFEVFKLKAISLDRTHSELRNLLAYACHSDKADLVKKLLEIGFRPTDVDDRGSSMIQGLLCGMSWHLYRFTDPFFKETDVDTDKSREAIKMIHMLARAGAVWQPTTREIADARRSLLKMKSDYIMEFIWIMSEYQACSKESIRSLIAKPAVRGLLVGHSDRLDELVGSWPETRFHCK